MANFFDFFPADGSATEVGIPAALVAAMPGWAPDDFGCHETEGGLYVPSLSRDEVKSVLAEGGVASGLEDSPKICWIDIFGEDI